MEKKAAVNKLAQAVKNYIQSEQQFNKIAATIQQYQQGNLQAGKPVQKQANLQKQAQGIMQRLGLKQAPKGNMGRNAALAALLLGGAGLGAQQAGLFGGEEENPSIAANRAAKLKGMRDSDAATYETGNNILDSLLGSGSGAGGALAGLQELIDKQSPFPSNADVVPDEFNLKGLDENVIKSLTETINSGIPQNLMGPRT